MEAIVLAPTSIDWQVSLIIDLRTAASLVTFKKISTSNK